MTDAIKKKYSRSRDTSYFNEFREPEIITKNSCKKCIILNFIFSLINSVYFSGFMYIVYKIHKYTDNDLLNNPTKFNNFINIFLNQSNYD